MIDTAPVDHVWAERYDRKLSGPEVAHVGHDNAVNITAHDLRP
ncbi:MAG: hypothetical protein ACREV0_03745 [Burkholderiales bacterium]